MYTTGEAILFFFVFFGQVVLISWLYPRRVVSDMRHVLQKYPPSTYPKMYPLPVEYYERRLRNCARVSVAIVVAGLLILAALIVGTFATDWNGAIVTPFSTSGEWDAAIVIPFFLVQAAGIAYLQLSGRQHFKAMAKVAPPRVRTTELRRRQLFDFVSPVALVAAVVTNVAFVAFVLYYRRFEFPWFTAAGNIALTVALNVLMAAMVGLVFMAPRSDFYQSERDRLNLIRMCARLALLVSIATPIGTAVQLLVKVLVDPEFLEPVMQSAGLQVFMLALLWPSSHRWDTVDFDGYRQDAPSEEVRRT